MTYRVLIAVIVLLSAVAGSQALLLGWVVAPGALAPIVTFAPILDKAIPAVVTLRVTGEKIVPIELKPRQRDAVSVALPAPEKEEFRTGGSGVIVDSANGYIVTNHHVIEDATKIDVGLSDGRRLLAKLIGQDIGSDLAVLKVEAKDLPSLVLGDSDAVRVGDVAIAVGNPFGLESTATLGMVGALMRTEIGHEAFEDYLQIDAQTNPGNSGGALVNARGELIGINTVIGGARGQGFSVGFAIPINMAKTILNELITNGRMIRGSPGLTVEDVPSEATPSGLQKVPRGVKVVGVLPNSSAAAAMVRPGDIVLRVGNKPVRNAAEYMTRVAAVPVNTQIPLVLYSDGKEKTVLVSTWSLALKAEAKKLQRQTGSISGAVIGDIMPGHPLYGDLRGAQVLEVPGKSPAYEVGIEVDDVIVGIDKTKVRSAVELFYRIEQAGLQYRVDIIRNGVPAWIRISK